MTGIDKLPDGSRPSPPPVAVLFDLDDTLYPERQFVDGGFRAVAAFLADRCHGPAPELVDRLWVLHARDGRGRLFDTLVAELGVDEDADLVRACLLVYRMHEPILTPFDWVEQAMRELPEAGIRTGVVSDGEGAIQARKLAALGPLADRFDLVVLTDLLGAGWAKPSPGAFRVACRLLEVPPSRVVYVGNDPRKDFVGAREAGLGTIRFGLLPDEGGTSHVKTGPPDDADIIVATYDELASHLMPTSGGNLRP